MIGVQIAWKVRTESRKSRNRSLERMIRPRHLRALKGTYAHFKIEGEPADLFFFVLSRRIRNSQGQSLVKCYSVHREPGLKTGVEISLGASCDASLKVSHVLEPHSKEIYDP
jgi:hypothetical protein